MIYKNGNIKEIYHGNVKVKELYKGSTLVYNNHPEFILYNYGIENVPFIQGYLENSPTMNKNSVNLEIKTATTSSKDYVEGNWATTDLIDLGEFNYINITWSLSQTVPTNCYPLAGILRSNIRNASIEDRKYYQSFLYDGAESFNYRTDRIEISSIGKGGNYIILSASSYRESSQNCKSELTVHKLWLEK